MHWHIPANSEDMCKTPVFTKKGQDIIYNDLSLEAWPEAYLAQWSPHIEKKSVVASLKNEQSFIIDLNDTHLESDI